MTVKKIYFILAVLLVLQCGERNPPGRKDYFVPDGDLPPSYSEDRIHLLKDQAGRAEWSPDGTHIAYHARGVDDYYDIHIMKADGTYIGSLTHDHPDLPNKHIGQPSWHPDDSWIVFQAEKSDHAFPEHNALAAPGIGYHNDIYIMRSDGSSVYRLTDLVTKQHALDPTPTCAVLQPHFSHDGTKISWSQRIADGDGWGEWEIRIAELAFSHGIPSLANIQIFQPGANRRYYESNDFMPGDLKLIICGNLEPGQDELGIDIYYLDMQSGTPERLTYSLDYFDECPHPSPDSRKICYLSTEGFPKESTNSFWWSWAKGEIWLMDSDGVNKEQLTHFNTPGYPEYIASRVLPAYISWNATGDKILLSIAVECADGTLKDQIYLLDLTK